MPLTPSELKSCLQGIIGFGITPFHDDLSINRIALRRNSSDLVRSCDILVPLGINGEIHSLSPEEQKLVGLTVVEEVRGRKPVVFGIGFSLPVARLLAQAGEAYGADGVLVLPPTTTGAGDDGLFE